MCEKERQLAQSTNILGTENLLEALGNLKLDKFIHASTGGIYSWKHKTLKEEITPLNPEIIIQLQNLLMRSKFTWGKKTLNKYVIVRIFNTIGPNDPNGHLLPDIFSQIDKTKQTNNISLGNINAKRDYIDVRDVANSITKIIKLKLSKKSEIINICNNSNYSVKDIIKIISKIFKTKIRVNVDKKKLRKFDRPHQTGSNKKLINIVGYKPKFNLQQSIINIIHEQFK